MTNSFIHLQSDCMRVLTIERVEDFVYNTHNDHISNELWINADDHTFIDFDLYPILNQIQLNEKITINELLFTVIEVIQQDQKHSSLVLS